MSKANLTAVDAKKIKGEWQKYYTHLLELREQLLHQMNGLAKESAQEMAGYSLHMADSGTDNFDRDFALSLLSSDQDAVYEIEEALKRIEKKTYGVCELTGKNIPARAARGDSVDAVHGGRAGAIGEGWRVEISAASAQLGTVDGGGVTEVETDDDEQPEEAKAAKEKE